MSMFCGPKEAASVLEVHVNTVYNLIRNGTIPATRLRGRWRIHLDALQGLRQAFLSQHDAGEWVAAADAAKTLGFHLNTIYRMIHQGTIPATRIGKKWRISKNWLDQFSHSIHSTTAASSSATVQLASAIRHVDTARDPMVLADNTNEWVLHINDAACELTGYSAHWWRTHSYLDAFHPASREGARKLAAKIVKRFNQDPAQSPIRASGEAKLVGPNGTSRTYHFDGHYTVVSGLVYSANGFRRSPEGSR